MTPDLAPFVVGKVLDAADAKVASVVLRREDGEWASSAERLDAEGTFATQASLAPRRPNVFRVEGITHGGQTVALQPRTFTIVHGVTISDPPLSRSIGVALANDAVQVFFERGSPLPMRRSFTLRTVETVSRGADGFALRVPIVQGEFALAHLCRLVGTIEIPSRDVKASLPAGSPVEVTLELDRGGRLSASARAPSLEQVFEQVAHLVAPQVPPEELATQTAALRARSAAVSGEAVQRGVGARAITKLGALDALFEDLTRDVERARGGDPDAAEKARRALLEIDAGIAEVEGELAWPALEAEVRDKIAWAVGWIGEHGTEDEKRVLRETIAAIDRARVAKDTREIERQIRGVDRIGWAAYYRWPPAWEQQLRHAESRVSEATDPRRAAALVRDANRAATANDRPGVERAVRELWQLLPPDAEERRLGHSSGVR
jgi:molecular chaperone DnaK